MSKEYKSKEEFINFILEELSKKFVPIEFGKFFLEISPSFGIENFRMLLDELNQQGLITKIDEPGEFIPSIGLSTRDLRYGLSIEGIKYLKSNPMEKTIDSTTLNNVNEIKVFVTYSWDNEEHNEKVIAFTNFLRDNGFHAEVDKMLIQNETAKDFKVMMHKGMTDYQKVVVILSEGYKIKAQDFKGGVGTEYSLILKDIETNPNKYILVSFEGHNDNIAPLFFKSREIIDFSKENETEKQKLFAKLLDKKLYEFSKVANELPKIKKSETPALFSKKENLVSDIKLNNTTGTASYLYQLLKNIELDLNLTFTNSTDSTLNEYSIEIHYPKHTVSYEVDGRVEGEYKIVTLEESNRIFSHQTKSIKLEKIILRNYTIHEIIDKTIIIKIFTEKGVSEKEFPLNEFIIRDFNGSPKKLDLSLFLPKNQ
ncbi:SEFIR domain-containing protein [Flavobacterium sp. HJJ]|uniref:SEFIR domain-containing protein n=1 Tax=Flavobacterium sp. HJJ TaxID=2783792 RepID=UPI00188CD1D8|nr:SEFIR domain-containing protein [Flavobacterium sp. HJJ]MBF4472720.1 TIR domain-containing protein [Flavobacterium sp. HJJ]